MRPADEEEPRWAPVRPVPPENARKRCKYFWVRQGLLQLRVRAALTLPWRRLRRRRAATGRGPWRAAARRWRAQGQAAALDCVVVGITAANGGGVKVGTQGPFHVCEHGSHSNEQVEQALVAGPDAGDGIAERRGRGRGFSEFGFGWYRR